MPRKRRPVHTDRPYHVFNRGNYREPIFETPGAVRAFLQALDETLKLFKWEVYAYAIMPNHYHLCLRTPDGDLSDGMQRLLTAFATRFNRFRKESGHVFQGRFKSVVAPKGLSVRRIIDYIHLNPTRSKRSKKTLEVLGRSNLTSLRAYLNPTHRGKLAVDIAFAKYVGFDDTPAGRTAYLTTLAKHAGEDPTGQLFEAEWKLLAKLEKAEMRKAAAAIVPGHAISRETVQVRRREHWESELCRRAEALGLELTELPLMPRRDPRKLELARQLYREAGVSSAWLASRLSLGRPSNLRTILAERGQTAFGP